MRNLATTLLGLVSVVFLFAGVEVSAQSLSQPLSAVLNADGTVKRNVAGSFDPTGFHFATRPDGEPRFQPAEQPAAGGCVQNWDTNFIQNGANNQVRVIVSDGLGNLYFGGDFSSIQGVAANRVAKWNGMAWTPLGSGIGGTSVKAIAIDGSDVYVGGDFGLAGGNPATNVAKWDGSAWSPLGNGLGGGTHIVESIAVFGNEVYIGGNFSVAGGAPADGLVKWNGTSLVGVGTHGSVYSLAVSGGALYAGGLVSQIGDSSKAGLVKWDGASWTGFGLLSTSTVRVIAFNGTDIYVGGTIRRTGSSDTSIARWNGTTWTSLGSFPSVTVRALAFLGTDIFAGGTFVRSGGNGIGNGVLKYNGSQWSAIGNGTEFGVVNTIYTSGNTFYIGGDFDQAGNVGARNIATLTDGTTWAAAFPGTGPDNGVRSIAVAGTDVYIGGTFRSVGSVSAHRIAKWNTATNTWSPLGTGLSGSFSESSFISAIAVVGAKVYAGGSFSNIGGIFTSNIAVWNGTNWTAMGSGVNGPVNVILAKGDDVYVAGNFTTAGGVAANRIAKWNGSAWSGLGSGSIPTQITTMAFMGDDIYVGTPTTTIANPAYFSKYDGTSWTPLGADLGDRGVNSVAVIGTDVYVAGGFTQIGATTVNRIAKWNGSSWSALGNGLPSPSGQSGTVRLGVSGSNLIATGDFTFAGGGPADRIAKWNGTSWVPLGTGTDIAPSVITSAGGDIFFGGAFTRAGCNLSANLARWRETLWTGATNTDWHTGANWGSGSVPASNIGVSITTANSTISSADVTVGNLIIGNGRTLSIAGGRTLTVTGRLDIGQGALLGPGSLVVHGDVNLYGGDLAALNSIVINGNLYLGGGKIFGSGEVSLTSCRPTALAGGNNTSFITSTLTRCVNSGGVYRFPVGTDDTVYAPVELSNINGSGNFSVSPRAGAYPGNPPGLPANRLQRWWDLTNGGITQTDITFDYIDSEVVGLESWYRVYRVAGAAQQLPTIINTTTNRMTVTGVTSFSGWTLAEGTSAPRTLVGRVTGASGRGATLVIVSLTDGDGNTRYAVTNPFGYYRFHDVQTFRTYTVGMMSKKYTFTAPQRLVQFDEFTPSVNFVATDH